jgi:hypothetical protein
MAIRLAEDQWQFLRDLAEGANTTLSAVAREIIQEVMEIDAKESKGEKL